MKLRRLRPLRTRLGMLIGLALLNPLAASADQIPCPVPPEGWYAYDANGPFNALVCVDDSALILTAPYGFTNLPTGSLQVNGGLQLLGGNLLNQGQIIVARTGTFALLRSEDGATAVLQNLGVGASITNSGFLTIQDSQLSNLAGAMFVNMGQGALLENRGSIVNDGVGTEFHNTMDPATFGLGQISNLGQVTNSGGAYMTTENGATFTNAAGASLTNTGAGSLFDVDGQFINDGAGSLAFNTAGAAFSITGTVSNRNGALLWNDAGSTLEVFDFGGQLLNASGSTLRNDGSFIVQAANAQVVAGQVTNDNALFSNTGSVQIDGSLLNQNAALLRNGTVAALFQVGTSGSLLNDTAATFSNEAGATLLSFGSIVNQGGSSWINDGPGTRFTHAGGAVFVNQGAGTSFSNRNGASLVNNGSIGNLNGASFTSDATASLLNAQGGQMLNSGSGSSMTLANAVNDGGGTALTNTGGATLALTGSFSNQFGAQLVNQAGSSINVSGALQNPSGQIVNAGSFNLLASGSLLNGGGFTNNGQVTSAGTFSVTAGGTMDGSGSYLQTGGTGVVNGVMTQGLIDIEGGVLKGTGTIAALNFIVGPGGVFAPGNSPGTLTLKGNVQFAGELDIEVASAQLFDQLIVHGTMSLAPGARIVLSFDQPLTDPSYSFAFLQVDGGLSGFSPSMISAPGGYGGYGAGWTDVCDGQGRCQLQLQLSAPVPEPGGGSLLLLGLAGLGWLAQRRRPS